MKIAHLRWWIAGLLFLSTVINYVDRQTLSVLAPVLGRELGISDIEYSNILTAFLAAYTVMYVGSGYLVDRWGTRNSLSLFMIWWSLANMAHAFARGAWSLGALRFLLGMGSLVRQQRIQIGAGVAGVLIQVGALIYLFQLGDPAGKIF